MKYRDIYQWLMLPLLLFAVAGLLFFGSACESTNTSISPPSKTVAPGETFTVDVLVTPAAHIAGAQFDLSFDPSLVTAISVEEGDLFNQGGFNTFFLPGTIDNNAGTITGVASVITTRGGTMTFPGTLVTITFIASPMEGKSPLDLTNVIAGDKQGQRVTVQVNSGSVTISNP